jgi:hypothetical protein
MPYFRETRNIELSTIYYLETQIDANWSGVNVILGYPNFNDVDVPIVSVRLNDNTSTYLEIGATTFDHVYGIIIDIFARSDGQRLDLADFIRDQLAGSWTYYTHSHASGTNEEIVRTDSGSKLFLMSINENRKVEIFDNPERQDRFRHIISFFVKKY